MKQKKWGLSSGFSRDDRVREISLQVSVYCSRDMGSLIILLPPLYRSEDEATINDCPIGVIQVLGQILRIDECFVNHGVLFLFSDVLDDKLLYTPWLSLPGFKCMG